TRSASGSAARSVPTALPSSCLISSKRRGSRQSPEGAPEEGSNSSVSEKNRLFSTYYECIGRLGPCLGPYFSCGWRRTAAAGRGLDDPRRHQNGKLGSIRVHIRQTSGDRQFDCVALRVRIVVVINWPKWPPGL